MKLLQAVVVAVVMSGESSIFAQIDGSCSHMWQCIIHADTMHINEDACKAFFEVVQLQLNIFVYFKVIGICITSWLSIF
jgi:hypothetical protein